MSGAPCSSTTPCASTPWCGISWAGASGREACDAKAGPRQGGGGGGAVAAVPGVDGDRRLRDRADALLRRRQVVGVWLLGDLHRAGRLRAQRRGDGVDAQLV